MLNAQAISMALPLAEQMDAGRVVVMPLGGSPLDHLVKASNISNSACIETETGGYEIDIFDMERRANEVVQPFERSRHDFVADDLVKVAAASVQRVLSMVRTKVAPTIGELVEQVNMRMSAVEPSQLANLRIETNNSTAALNNPAMARLIEKFELTPPNEPSINTSLPRLSAAEIMPLLETGIATLDQDVAEWIHSIDSYTLENIWSLFFAAQTPRNDSVPGGASVTPTQQSFSTLINGFENAPLIVFLAARHMLENDVVLEGTEMSLQSLRGTLKTYQEQAGRVLNRQLEKNATSVKNGVLVLSLTPTVITVNTPVYNAWLANGGDNDILFGMAVSGKQTFTVNGINAASEEYRNGWKKYVALVGAADGNRRFNYLRDQLVLCYEGMLGQEQDQDGHKLEAAAVIMHTKNFQAQLNQLTIADTHDLYTLCLKLICRTRYSKSPAESFLLKMDEVAKGNPNLSPREAGTIATIDYICDWVAAQFVVVPG